MNPLIVEFYRDRAKEWRWRMKRSGRVVADSAEGYSRKDKAARAVRSIGRAFATSIVRFVALAMATSALAVNSPRPSSFHADNGRLILVWTNLSEAHPWLLSYRTNMATPWLWDTTRLHAVGRALTVAIPMEEQQGYYRLWPAP